MSLPRRVAGVLAAALLLAGCTTNSGADSAGPASATTSPASSASAPSGSAAAGGSTSHASAPATPPPPPAARACYRLTLDQARQPSNDSRPVACAGRHNAQTIYVGRLDTVVDGHALAVDSDRAIRQLSTTCPRRLASYLGGSSEDRHLSRLEVVWFGPTLEQADQGATWFRCDVIAIADKKQLFDLPPPRRLAGLLDRPGAAAYALCGTAAPGEPAFARVICARGHSWRAVATIDLAGGAAYPGTGKVRALGDSSCRDRVRAHAPDPLKFRYGWEWPTREQWKAGQHYGFCWAPD